MKGRPIDKIAYGIEEAADALGIGRTLFLEKVGEYGLKSFNINGRRLFRKRDLEAFADRLYAEQHGVIDAREVAA
jgi:hypothetical protein